MSGPYGAGWAKTYSLLVASGVVRDTVGALAAAAGAPIHVGARGTYAAAVPAFAHHGRPGGKDSIGVGLRENRQLV